MPHMLRTAALYQHLPATRLAGQAALASLDLLPAAVWLLGQCGELLHANPAARRLTTRGDVITQAQNGRPHACVTSEDQRLQRLLMAALQAGLGRGNHSGGAMRMWGKRAGGMLQVLVIPLFRGLSGFGAAAAALIATDSKSLPHDLEGNLQQLYELTPAEARMAAAMVAGEAVHEFAVRVQISEATARSHLKSILAKTAARRQSDLVRIIVTGPAMLSRKPIPDKEA